MSGLIIVNGVKSKQQSRPDDELRNAFNIGEVLEFELAECFANVIFNSITNLSLSFVTLWLQSTFFCNE